LCGLQSVDVQFTVSAFISTDLLKTHWTFDCKIIMWN